MKYLIANFKQNGDREFYKNYAQYLRAHFRSNHRCLAIFCVPAPYLHFVRNNLHGRSVLTGGQTVSQHTSGPFTGCISASMLADFGVYYTIINHSEHHSASRKKITEKIVCCKQAGINAIYCIGKDIKKNSEKVDNSWIEDAISAIPKDVTKTDVIIAYEPVFAVGTGKQPTVSEINAVVKAIRKATTEHLGHELPVIYGGSVTPQNCKQIADGGVVDGFMVGGACLDPDSLTDIYNILVSSK